MYTEEIHNTIYSGNINIDKISAKQLEKYKTNIQNDTFLDETINAGKNLMETINEAKKIK